MKNFKYILLFAPVFLAAQNNLFFNRVLTFSLNTGQEVSVPANKAWNIKASNRLVRIKTLSPEYGFPVTSPVNNIQLSTLTENSREIWLGEGDILISGETPTNYSILEYDVIPISSGTSGGSTSSGGFTSTTDFAGSGQYSATSDYTVANSFTDIDGNEYGAVNIVGSVWATSNLKVTKFTDGTPIKVVADSNEMAVTMEPACIITSSGNVYYNWFAINESNGKKLAPEGYRITSVSDWQRLIDFYGGGLNAAHFMKGRAGWNTSAGGNGLDKSGLNLLPNGILGRTPYDKGVGSWATNNIGNFGFSNYGEFKVVTINYNSNSIYDSEIYYGNASYKKRSGDDPNYNWTAAVSVRVVKDY